MLIRTLVITNSHNKLIYVMNNQNIKHISKFTFQDRRTLLHIWKIRDGVYMYLGR